MTLMYDDKAEKIARETLLSEKEAELYVLKTRNGYTLDEAAHQMNVKSGNIYGKWARVKDKIAKAKRTAKLSSNISGDT